MLSLGDMYQKIKGKIEKELRNYLSSANKAYSLRKLSPLLFRRIKEFVLRKGKRVRPVMFVVGYLGFTKRAASGLYRSAISFELLHDFLLVHDDIVDKSATRRGKPSMHKLFDQHLAQFKSVKFTGQDLAIVAGDVIYSMAADAFVAIKEDPKRKQDALQKFAESGMYTGIGEFVELLSGVQDIAKIKKSDIYKIYDCKTAFYTFASPLSCGAIVAGASKQEAERLHQYGIHLGRAFQIKDDILGIFAEERETGKSPITDLQEAKKTILLWHAYNNTSGKDRLQIKKVLANPKVKRKDLLIMRKIIKDCGSLDYASDEIRQLLHQAQTTIKPSKMKLKYKKFLSDYSKKLITL